MTRRAFRYKGRCLRMGIVAVWVALVLWLVRFEAFPEYFTHSLTGYETLFSRDMLIRDSWMRVLFNGAPIGYSRTSVDVRDGDPFRHYAVNNELQIGLSLMGVRQPVGVDSAIYLDAMHQLQSFSFEVSTGVFEVIARGRRVEGETFDIVVRMADSTTTNRVTIPDDVVIYSPVNEMAVRRLRPGQQLTVKTLDPISMRKDYVTLRALRREPIVIGDREYAATVLSTEYHGMQSTTWLGPDGRVLRQQTPLGWTLEACTADEAFTALRESEGGGDLLTGLALQFLSWGGGNDPD